MHTEIESTSNSIHIGQSTNEILNSILASKYSGKKKVIITDDNVFEYWIEQLVTSVPELSEAEIIQLPSGEDSKCIEISIQVWESLSDNKIGRGDLILNFGGGVITDLGGFIASTYKRGIDYINIPTTLLAQIDASIGGKNGIDLGALKNQIGTFSNAVLILVNPNYLSTLPADELNSGYAEMLKHGLIASRDHWNELKEIDFNQTEALTRIICNSITIKNDIVLSDPKEKDKRKSLNFGHTIGHAVEGLFLKKKQTIKHGHAIALGMIAESFISYKSGFLNKTSWDEIYYILTDKYAKITLESSELPELIRLMQNDKKNTSSEVNFTLLSNIGSHIINQEVADTDILEAIKLIST